MREEAAVIVRLAVVAVLAGAALLFGRFFLGVWERTIAATDDAALEDDALDGPDTTPRG